MSMAGAKLGSRERKIAKRFNWSMLAACPGAGIGPIFGPFRQGFPVIFALSGTFYFARIGRLIGRRSFGFRNERAEPGKRLESLPPEWQDD
jgi:hypothetical protein